MQRVYCTYEKDWMGFKISKRNFLTFHHITKRCMKGLEDIDNGALLGKKSHELLNMIEIFDEDLYNRWNDLFMDINASKCKISDFNMQRIYQRYHRNSFDSQADIQKQSFQPDAV